MTLATTSQAISCTSTDSKTHKNQKNTQNIQTNGVNELRLDIPLNTKIDNFGDVLTSQALIHVGTKETTLNTRNTYTRHTPLNPHILQQKIDIKTKPKYGYLVQCPMPAAQGHKINTHTHKKKTKLTPTHAN